MIDHIIQGRGKRWTKKAVVLFLEAAVFGIGLEVSKDLYRLIRNRAMGEEEGQDLPPQEDIDVEETVIS